MKNFTMYEMDREGLTNILFGSYSKRYSDRISVKKIDYTDRKVKVNANIKADNGLYKNDKILLNKNVIYSRDDGVRFESEMANYDKKQGLFTTDKEFIIYRGKSSTKGSTLRYNSNTKKINATKTKTIYQLQESKK